MNDKRLSQICLIITIIGMILLLATYTPEFEEKKVSDLLKSDGEKGILFGRIDHVIKNYPSTMFIFTDGNKTTVYYPRESDLNKNDFVYIYAESQIHGGKQEIYAYKVVKE